MDGGADNDVLVGSDGADTADTAVFSGALAEYEFEVLADGSVLVTDTVAGRDGSDTLSEIEVLRFSDGEVSVASVTAPSDVLTVGNVSVGSSGDDVIVGSDADDVIEGGAGDDYLYAPGWRRRGLERRRRRHHRRRHRHRPRRL